MYDGVEDRFNTGYYNNEQAVLLIVSRQPDANIIQTVDAIYDQLPALRAFLPPDVQLAIASDRSPTIRATLHEAERSLLIAVMLVILVVLLFLASLRAAMIPVAAVPVPSTALRPRRNRAPPIPPAGTTIRMRSSLAVWVCV